MKLNSIQILRALAALMVVYTHSISQVAIFASGWQQAAPIHTSLGTFGVDLFFVISGFIICHSAGRQSGRSQAFTFLWHRFRRINPLYYVAVLFTFLSWLPAILTHRRPPVSGMQLLSWLILFPLPGAPQRAVSQAWTLSFEWYFYLLFFLLIFFRIRRKGTTLTIWSASLVLLGWLVRDRRTGVLGFYMDPTLIEFLLGVGIAAAYRKWTPGKAIARCILWPGIIAGLLLLITGYDNYLDSYVPQTAGLVYFHALYWGGASALIVAGMVFLEKRRSPLFQKPPPVLMLLGDASYSIYLFHLLIFGLLGALYLRVGFFLRPDLAIPVEALAVTLFCLLIYKWLELPLIRWLQRFDPPRPNPPR